MPIDEAHPLQAQSPYSASKIAADQFADSFHRSFGLPVVTVRPFNTYGPRQSARAVIPTIITQALAHAPIALGNLTPTRDLTYVDDMVDGFLRAASTDAAIGLVINLGTGREASIGDLVALVGRILGRPLEVRADSERVRPAASEVDRLCASTARAREVLGLTPAASLEEGVAKTIEWIGANLATFRSRGYAV